MHGQSPSRPGPGSEAEWQVLPPIPASVSGRGGAAGTPGEPQTPGGRPRQPEPDDRGTAPPRPRPGAAPHTAQEPVRGSHRPRPLAMAHPPICISGTAAWRLTTTSSRTPSGPPPWAGRNGYSWARTPPGTAAPSFTQSSRSAAAVASYLKEVLIQLPTLTNHQVAEITPPTGPDPAPFPTPSRHRCHSFTLSHLCTQRGLPMRLTHNAYTSTTLNPPKGLPAPYKQ